MIEEEQPTLDESRVDIVFCAPVNSFNILKNDTYIS